MSWYPSPNPGGQNRRLVREAVAEWITAQHVGGLQRVWSAAQGPDRVDWEAVAVGTGDPRCQATVTIPRVSESRTAGTGPTNPGGKTAHYDVELELQYLSALPMEWADAIDDFDRIVDAVKDCVRARGRDLGRPDVILQAGEWPKDGSITDEVDEPVNIDGGIYITGTVYFTVSQYMQAQP